MVYKQAPKTLYLSSPWNSKPSHLRYLQYISRRGNGSDWPRSDSPLSLHCVILRALPLFDGGRGCRPLVCVHGPDSSSTYDGTPKPWYSPLWTNKNHCHSYPPEECALVKLDIRQCIQGDVVLECVHLNDDLVTGEIIFKSMFHTAFIQSNVLILTPDEVDVLWSAKVRFPRDFKAEVFFSSSDSASSITTCESEDGTETEIILPEGIFKIQSPPPPPPSKGDPSALTSPSCSIPLPPQLSTAAGAPPPPPPPPLSPSQKPLLHPISGGSLPPHLPQSSSAPPPPFPPPQLPRSGGAPPPTCPPQPSPFEKDLSDVVDKKVPNVMCSFTKISVPGSPDISEMVVTLSGEETAVIDRLTRGSSQRDIVSIVEMGGIGKTTLAKKVYSDPRVIYYFHRRAWCLVSPVYGKREFLLDIIKDIQGLTDEIHQMSDADLESKLYRILKGIRYLIVMDDMWDIGSLNELVRSFPDDKFRSRILITSRFQNVALGAKPGSEPHMLRPLSDDESLDILIMKAFPEGDGYPEELLSIGKEIVCGCKGLPLAVVVVTGVLRRAVNNPKI